MTPKSAYSEIASRAKWLLRLYDGVLDQRRYRIRSDWKQAFTRIMHWPSSSLIERVDSTQAIIIL